MGTTMSKTRKTLIGLTAATALSVAACAAPADTADGSAANATPASHSATQESATAAVEPVAEPEPELDHDAIAEMAYMATVDEFTYPSREEAILLGRTACALMDQGTTAQELVMEAVTTSGPVVPGFKNEELARFYGAAVGTFCQQHGGQLGIEF